MKFQVFHVNPGEKLMKKDDNNKLIRSFINFPNIYLVYFTIALVLQYFPTCVDNFIITHKAKS